MHCTIIIPLKVYFQIYNQIFVYNVKRIILFLDLKQITNKTTLQFFAFTRLSEGLIDTLNRISKYQKYSYIKYFVLFYTEMDFARIIIFKSINFHRKSFIAIFKLKCLHTIVLFFFVKQNNL